MATPSPSALHVIPTIAPRGQHDRRARPRHPAKLEALRVTCAAVERALPVVLSLGDDEHSDSDAPWADFLDADGLRVRRVMRRTLALRREAARLEMEQNRLRQLLQEHRLASRVLAGMLQTAPVVDDWHRDVARWRALAETHFQPWTMAACRAEMEAALQQVDAFQWSTDKHTSGVCFLGWRDLQRVDAAHGVFQFQFSKTFRGYAMMDYVDSTWATYTTTQYFQEVIIGPRARGCLHVLQELAPHIVIAKGVERYEAIGVDAHMVYIVFRVATPRGFTHCARAIHCPELMNAFNEPKDMWAANSVWLQWEQLDEERNANDFKMRIGGSIVGGNDVNYTNRWMLEAFGCVLRSERLATGRALISSS